MKIVGLRRAVLGLAAILLLVVAVPRSNAQPPKGWVQGKGYGWIWGPNDEIGALNAITPQKVMEALRIPKQGKVYDLGAAVRPRVVPVGRSLAGRGHGVSHARGTQAHR